MSLPSHIYKMLENIVGEENISDEDHILAAYRHKSSQGGRIPASPDAVIMPENTEEVQSIVRICNRYDIKFKAIASLFGVGGIANQPGLLIISLRRMNRILEINEEDRYAVIEPAVRHVQLKPEVMKRGLSFLRLLTTT